uniref:Purine-binding chemotaxis protein CheW n=1 Tax=candidate division WOR-3 bacterium TaxID=2052148 RepID=A0A7C4UGW7_UNCW3
MEILTFRLQNEGYGIELSRVVEIVENLKIIKVPLAPVYVEGIANLRGDIIAVINLKKRFKGEGGNESPFVIITKYGDEKVGLTVDTIEGIKKVSEEEINIPEKTIKKLIPPEFISGVFTIEKDKFLLLNIQKIIEEKGG